jgi:hypothetical protein
MMDRWTRFEWFAARAGLVIAIVVLVAIFALLATGDIR